MKSIKYLFLLLSVGSAIGAPARPNQALPPSIPPADYVALSRPQASASGVVITRPSAVNLLKYIDKYTTKPSNFVTTSRNPFLTSFGGMQATGSMTAKDVWESVKKSLQIVGVNINREDSAKSAMVLGDTILKVGLPLPDYVLDSPVKVVLVSLTEDEAVFRILMPDPNRMLNEENIKAEDFKLRVDNELLPSIAPKSTLKVNIPTGNTRKGTDTTSVPAPRLKNR